MIYINITNEQGELLGRTDLSLEDFTADLRHPPFQTKAWIGEKVLRELPTHPVALRKLLLKDGEE